MQEIKQTLSKAGEQIIKQFPHFFLQLCSRMDFQPLTPDIAAFGPGEPAKTRRKTLDAGLAIKEVKTIEAISPEPVLVFRVHRLPDERNPELVNGNHVIG